MTDVRKDGSGEEQPAFKVTDRRAFTAEGERRHAETTPAVTPATPPATEAGPKSQAEARPPRAAAPPSSGDVSRRAPQPSLDFITFLHSLSMTALMALGEVENPDTRRFETNLELARQNIDILAILREKTEGNLTDEESRFIHEIVPQLQLRYVEKVKGS